MYRMNQCEVFSDSINNNEKVSSRHTENPLNIFKLGALFLLADQSDLRLVTQ